MDEQEFERDEQLLEARRLKRLEERRRRVVPLGEDGPRRRVGSGLPAVRRALVAMHEAPAHPWSLDTLADAAGMSRSAFADAFRASVGQTPGQYLQGWRIGLAQRALRRGRPLKLIADEVGYGSEAALSRAFKAHSGVSPRAWRQARVAHGAAA